VSQTGTISRVGAGRARLGGVRGNPALTLLAVALGVIMVALDGTIVAVANPAIQANLHASLAEIQWVTNGYLLALAVTLITIGKFGDRFGHRNVFLIGIGGFGATSAAVGLSGDIAHSIGLVIAFRVAQGVFGAMLQPTALALLSGGRPSVPPRRPGRSSAGCWCSTSTGSRSSTSTSRSARSPWSWG
jgi:MFS family permease